MRTQYHRDRGGWRILFIFGLISFWFLRATPKMWVPHPSWCVRRVRLPYCHGAPAGNGYNAAPCSLRNAILCGTSMVEAAKSFASSVHLVASNEEEFLKKMLNTAMGIRGELLQW